MTRSTGLTTVEWRVALVPLVLGACTGTIGSPITCGEGTHLQDDVCVVDAVGDAGPAAPDDVTAPGDAAVPGDAARPTADGARPAADAGGSAPADAGQEGCTKPAYGFWAWGKPDIEAIAQAGFKWFESGYPGTLSASDNQYLTEHGTVPIAYINIAEVPNDDAYLQGQIGSWYTSIVMCVNTDWNTSVVDVRDPRWQAWLLARADYAYSLGNRGIKWDVAAVEGLCGSWGGNASAAQAAVDAMGSVLTQLKSRYPDLKSIVNQGFGLATQYAAVVDGFQLENMINYYNANPGDQWSNDYIAAVSAIHAASCMPILDLEYINLMGCSDLTCPQVTQLYNQILALDWVPYIASSSNIIQGRGLGITPPW